MLHELDDSLKNMLVRGCAAHQPDIAFETPDGMWGAGINKPTLNVFLWDIRRSADESHAGRELVYGGAQPADAGGPSGYRWRPRPPRIEFHYLVTAWTTKIEDEHALLGQALVAILRCPVLVGADTPSFVQPGDPAPTLRVARTDGKDLAEFWGAIEGKLKPGLNVIVTATVDPGVTSPAGRRTTSIEVTTGDLTNQDHRDHLDHDENANPDRAPSRWRGIGWETLAAEGTAVRASGTDANGRPVTHGSGRVREHESSAGGRRRTYRVRGRPGDTITIDSRPEIEYTFPPRAGAEDAGSVDGTAPEAEAP